MPFFFFSPVIIRPVIRLDYKQVQEVFVGEDNYVLVKILAGIVNGFKGVGCKPAIVANCATTVHEPDEIIRIDPFKNDIPYNWELKEK